MQLWPGAACRAASLGAGQRLTRGTRHTRAPALALARCRYLTEKEELPEHIVKELSTRSSTTTPWWWGFKTLVKVRPSH